MFRCLLPPFPRDPQSVPNRFGIPLALMLSWPLCLIHKPLPLFLELPSSISALQEGICGNLPGCCHLLACNLSLHLISVGDSLRSDHREFQSFQNPGLSYSTLRTPCFHTQTTLCFLGSPYPFFPKHRAHTLFESPLTDYPMGLTGSTLYSS